MKTDDLLWRPLKGKAEQEEEDAPGMETNLSTL